MPSVATPTTNTNCTWRPPVFDTPRLLSAKLVARMLSRALALAGIVIIMHSQTGIQQVLAVAATRTSDV